MEKLEKILMQMRHEPANVRFSDLQNICEVYFGKPRQLAIEQLGGKQ